MLAHAVETGELDGLVDERLEKNYIESEMFRMIEAAAACVRHSSVKRPRMGLVIRALNCYLLLIQRKVELLILSLLLFLQVLRALSMSDSGDLSNGLRVGESQLYDSAQQSAEIRWFRRMAFGGSQDISSGYFSNSSQNLGFSGQSRRNGDLSTQHNRNSQTVGIPNQSGNNVNFSSERRSSQHNQHGHNRNSQNVGLPNQSGNNVNFSAEHHSSQYNQGNRNPNFFSASPMTMDL